MEPLSDSTSKSPFVIRMGDMTESMNSLFYRQVLLRRLRAPVMVEDVIEMVAIPIYTSDDKSNSDRKLNLTLEVVSQFSLFLP